MNGAALQLASRRLSPATLARRYPGAEIVDLTSRGPEPWVRFSPFFPHGGIPVPRSEGATSESVEGIWQALKVFESADVDPTKLAVTTMKGLKRTVRRFGRCLGHRDGLAGASLLPYIRARHAIYLPAYRWTLEHRLQNEVAALRELAASAAARDVATVVLDYEVNADVDDPARPLSHAALVIRYLRGDWPRSA
ncbi:MAG: hypothetical protein AAF721_32225 [Myxococcota bacterium]